VAGANSSHGWETTSAECRINFSHLLVTANGASRNFPRDMKNSGEEEKTKKKKKRKRKWKKEEKREKELGNLVAHGRRAGVTRLWDSMAAINR